MTISYPPKVKVDISATGRGSVSIDGFELRWVNAVNIAVQSGSLTKITIQISADVEFVGEGAEIVLDAIPLSAKPQS